MDRELKSENALNMHMRYNDNACFKVEHDMWPNGASQVDSKKELVKKQDGMVANVTLKMLS